MVDTWRDSYEIKTSKHYHWSFRVKWPLSETHQVWWMTRRIISIHTDVFKTSASGGHNAWGRVPTVGSIARSLWQVHNDSKTRQIGLNHDYNVRFQCHPVNISIRHLNGEYGAWSESRFARYTHCYVTLCSLTTRSIASHCPSPREPVLVPRYFKPL